jgi:prophage regulatory protein
MCTLWPENTAWDFNGASSISIYQSQSPQQRRRLSMAKIETTQIRRTIRRQQLREMVPMADSTIYEMEQRGEFPRRFALSPRCIVWDLAEVEAWLTARRAAPIRRAQHPDVTKRKTRPVKERDPVPSRA